MPAETQPWNLLNLSDYDITAHVELRERIERRDGGVARELPRYLCHKQVHALKIARVVRPTTALNTESDGSMILVPADLRYAPFRVSRAYAQKHDPQAGGYFVVYADGYESFSPAEPFESGYTEVR
jgi:hypothetical protein